MFQSPPAIGVVMLEGLGHAIACRYSCGLTCQEYQMTHKIFGRRKLIKKLALKHLEKSLLVEM